MLTGFLDGHRALMSGNPDYPYPKELTCHAL